MKKSKKYKRARLNNVSPVDGKSRLSCGESITPLRCPIWSICLRCARATVNKIHRCSHGQQLPRRRHPRWSKSRTVGMAHCDTTASQSPAFIIDWLVRRQRVGEGLRERLEARAADLDFH